VRADEVTRREHLVQVVAADDAAEDQHAGEKAQAAAGGDDERHARAVARGRVVMPITDQQKRKEARELPEKYELDQISGEHDAEHRAHESEQECEEARHRVARRHVVARIEHDEKADQRDERREHPRIAVDAHDEIESERR
jgi:hypothetical protein